MRGLEPPQMAWVTLVALALVLWAACGAVIAIGRKVWSIDTTLRVHLVARCSWPS